MTLYIAIALLGGIGFLIAANAGNKKENRAPYMEMLDNILKDHAGNDPALLQSAIVRAKKSLKNPKKDLPNEKQILKALYEIKAEQKAQQAPRLS